MYDLAQSRTQKFAINREYTVLKSKFNLSSEIKPNLGFELRMLSTNLSEKPCRSKRRESFWRTRCKSETNRHQEVVGTLLLLDREDGLTPEAEESDDPILFESELSSSIPALSSNSRIFREYNRSCIAKQCAVARRFLL